MTATKTIVIATHRRSGTHWTIDALRNNSPEICNGFLTLERIEASHDAPIPLDDFRLQLKGLDGRVLVKVHDLPTATYWKGEAERKFARSVLGSSPIIYVHRDGRDVMVSLYYYMQSFSEVVKGQSFSAFLRGEAALDGVATGLSRPAYWAHHAGAWLTQPNLLAVSYGALESDYEAALRGMAVFLDVKLNRSLRTIQLPGAQRKPFLLERIRWKLGIRQKKLSSAVQPRRGKSDDWRVHFSDHDLAFFMSEAGEMMARLGYLERVSSFSTIQDRCANRDNLIDFME